MITDMATIGKISNEEAKRREKISQQKRIEAFNKKKNINQKPVRKKPPLTRSRAAAEKKKQEAEKKKQEEKKKKERYDRNLKLFERIVVDRSRPLKF